MTVHTTDETCDGAAWPLPPDRQARLPGSALIMPTCRAGEFMHNGPERIGAA
jgi:hypothetical protein